MLHFEGVTKKFGQQIAVDNISFKIDKGEFVFLVGPSGAGKTTILRLIIRDILPTNGVIKVDDFDVVNLPSNKIHLLRRKVGMIFQDFKILFDRTVFENVAVALEILGKDSHEIETAAKEILKLVGLWEKRSYFPAQLSAGELQRASIARAVIGKPEVLLADEPTGNLDPKTGWDILKILNEINKQGTLIFMATHNVDVVNSMDKRVIKVAHGKIIKDQKKGKYF